MKILLRSFRSFPLVGVAPLAFSWSLPFLAILLLVLPSLTRAQPDREVTRLLFEPVPMPADPATTIHPLVSFNAAEAELPTPASDLPRLTTTERREIQADIDAYKAVVGENEATEGPYSTTLREDLFSTGLLYQRIDDHREAIRMFERALNVSRVNFGLENPDQIPIMQAMARSYEAQLLHSRADGMMDGALQIASKRYGTGSPALAPYLHELGDWNTEAFMNRSSILVNIPRMNVQNFLTDPRNYIQPTMDARQTPLFKLYEARSDYLNAIKAMVDDKRYRDPELLELERKLLTNYFLSMHRENILYEPDFYLTRKKSKTTSRLDRNAIELSTSDEYDEGRKSHRRIRDYLFVGKERDYPRIAQAMLEEADWDLLFQRKQPRGDRYDSTYAYFHDNPDRIDDQVRARLYPEVPVVLPTYLPPPNSREKLGIAPGADVAYFGYIDVRFELNRYGKARKIKLLRTEGEVTRNMEIRLAQYLRKVQFRPRFRDGARDTEPLELRYYIGV